MPHRCALGCKNTDVVGNVVFPNLQKFPELYKAWINLCHGKLETSSDYEVYKKERHDIHFAVEHQNRYKRLNALAVPTLHLPELPEPPGIDLPKASSSSQPVTATEVCVSSAGTILSEPSSSSQLATNPPEPSGTHLSKTAITDDSIAAKSSVMKEHNYYSTMSRPRRNEMFKGLSGTRSSGSVSTTELPETPGIDLPKASNSSQPATAAEVCVSSAGTILSEPSSSSQLATNPPEPSGTHLSKTAIIGK